ncbi:hypothetical protein DFQ27_002785 [Actinomortierella ambigua]|uniref:FAD-binding PCMH-type domain-containing protein n=1 Tax=Actinomortierella ambigua TaxID=1343610 RepID=A0A9P6Q6H7_9FUNG|nr:hypothetical protein DFQ27_002785 [Actinomortierella ambigua]
MRLSPSSLLPLTVWLSVALLAVAPASAAAPDDTDPLEHSRTRLQCKCQPTQPCWPSDSAWSALKEAVGGRLIATKPVAYVCHPEHYDKAKCDVVKKDYYYGVWRQNQPGALQMTNWETHRGEGCLLNQTTACLQGAVPLYTVNVSTVADVQASVRFAAKHNLRLSIKNTGHDYLGRSTAPASLSLWTYFKKKIQVVDSFVPDGALKGTEGTNAIVFEAGAQWIDAYKEVAKHNRIVVGGMAATVGTSGGYCLSGGHSPFSPRHGLCVDNVLQYKVVTADGELRVANAYQHQDLFWALRGGGPGFGVVVEAVYRTHVAPKHLNFAVVVIASNITAQMDKVVQDYYSRVPKWVKDEGWSGYVNIAANYIGAMLFLPDASLDTARASLQPFVDHARSLGSDIEILNNTIIQVPSLYEIFKASTPVTSVQDSGANVVLGSRLIPRTMFKTPEGTKKLTLTMRKVLEDFQDNDKNYLVLMVADGQVAKGNARETSVVPAWRDAQVFINFGAGWPDDTPYAQQVALQRKVTKATDRLRQMTPGSGTYQNEADPDEPNFQQSFFGANYPRLYKLKHKYDPHGLFICRRCVGSDDWNTDGSCPRRR